MSEKDYHHSSYEHTNAPHHFSAHAQITQDKQNNSIKNKPHTQESVKDSPSNRNESLTGESGVYNEEFIHKVNKYILDFAQKNYLFIYFLFKDYSCW